jgi:hypothetical protein
LSAINPGLAGAVLAAAASAAIVTGLSGGKLADILKAAVVAGVTAFAFAEIGTLTNFHGVALSQLNASNISNFAANIAGHAAIGCLSAVASGGKCEAGAISAAAGAAAAPLVLEATSDASTNATVQKLEGSAISGVVGGLASLAGGGKFEDGAVTAAFGYLFNAGLGNRGPACDAACIAHGEMMEQNLAINLVFGLLTLPFALAYDTLEVGVLAANAFRAASLWDIEALPQLARFPNVLTDVTAQEFQQNLLANGYSVFRSGVSSNGPFSVLSNGGDLIYTIYTGTSTLGPSAQVYSQGLAQILMKYRLYTP